MARHIVIANFIHDSDTLFWEIGAKENIHILLAICQFLNQRCCVLHMPGFLKLLWFVLRMCIVCVCP